MSTENGCEPIFPDDRYYGLTKREWLAGMALTAILSNSSMTEDPNFDAGCMENACVQYADGLLARLEKQGQP